MNKYILMRLHFERYFSHHGANDGSKYLSKRSLVKHTYSWRDKVIILTFGVFWAFAQFKETGTNF